MIDPLPVQAPQLGMTGSVTRIVTAEMTADHHGIPGAHVLASPVLALLFELASIEALRERCGEELRTLGVGLAFSHTAPTPVGFQVTVEAKVEEVAGRRVRFEVRAHDDAEVIGTGTHDRVIVDWPRVLESVRRKRGTRFP
jgi:fluoroacetyl-CoA thioesterase